MLDYSEKLKRYTTYEDAKKRHRPINEMFIFTLALMGICGAVTMLLIALTDMRDVPTETPAQRADSIGAAIYHEAGAQK